MHQFSISYGFREIQEFPTQRAYLLGSRSYQANYVKKKSCLEEKKREQKQYEEKTDCIYQSQASFNLNVFHLLKWVVYDLRVKKNSNIPVCLGDKMKFATAIPSLFSVTHVQQPPLSVVGTQSFLFSSKNLYKESEKTATQ